MRRTPMLDVLKAAGAGAAEDKVAMMGAALAYYTMFSIAPLLVIALGIIGMVFGEGGDRHVFAAIGSLVGENGAMAIRGMVRSAAARPSGGLIAAVVGAATLTVGASGVFVQLQESLNMIWKVAQRPRAGIRATLRRRLLSFAMVGVIAFMLLVSLLASAGIAAVGTTIGDVFPGGQGMWRALDFAISVAVTAVLFALVFKVLPDVRISWRDGLVGGFFTAVLFTAGKFAVGAYLGHSGVASTYGAAGSLIVVLLWVYYSSQLVLVGAEFTRAYATRDGGTVVPKRDARLLVTTYKEGT